MSDDEEWFDVTAFGSPYEVQTSNRGGWRHRRISLGAPLHMTDDETTMGRAFVDLDWRPGSPPADGRGRG